MKNEFDAFNLDDTLRFFEEAMGIALHKYDLKVVVRVIYEGCEIITYSPPGVEETEPVEVPYIIGGVEQGVFHIAGLKEQENGAFLEKALEEADHMKRLRKKMEDSGCEDKRDRC